MFQKIYIFCCVADKQQFKLPDDWKKPKDGEYYCLVPLSTNDNAYKNVEKLFRSTGGSGTITSV